MADWSSGIGTSSRCSWGVQPVGLFMCTGMHTPCKLLKVTSPTVASCEPMHTLVCAWRWGFSFQCSLVAQEKKPCHLT